MFEQYIGIDYSGAQTPETGLRGLRIYRATRDAAPQEILPARETSRYWTRRGVAGWLQAMLASTKPTIVGIDHSFSFPEAYFRKYRLSRNWAGFLDDFARHWPTSQATVTVEAVRRGRIGKGVRRTGSATWRRVAEVRARAKSVFHFDVPGSVAKSTHAGLPWLRDLRLALGGRVHFWPYDGWKPPARVPVVVEAYPALCSMQFSRRDRTPDQHDAYAVAAWLRREDAAGRLAAHFTPALTPEEKAIAAYEGWIFGV